MELEEDPDSKVLELKLKALILETLHYIDIVETLSDGKVRSTDHWLWQKQLREKLNSTHFHRFLGRFYLDRGGQAVVRMVDAEFEYTYEYQVTLSDISRVLT